MTFNQKPSTLIELRTSTRTYTNEKPAPSVIGQIEKILSSASKMVDGYSDLEARFILTTRDPGKSEKVGTYGVIYGAESYIVGLVHKDRKNPLAFGEIFESIVLGLTDIGLKTCWLGGTFNKADFEKNLNLDENEQIAIITPVGYGKEKVRLFEAAMRKLIKADQRKPWEDLFFENDFKCPLLQDRASQFKKPLEMVRLGPSASNKQPWRILKIGDAFHFYLKRTPGYGVAGFDMQLNDIGIAKCHFELTVKELGLEGTWKTEDPGVPSNGMEYVVSWYYRLNEGADI